MSNEAVVTTSLQITKGNQQYQSKPSSYRADISAAGGPTPGVVSIATAAGGTAISLAALTTPGLCRLQNLDLVNYVEVGVHDGTTFFPVLKLLAGECAVVRLAGLGSTTLRGKANTAAVKLWVEAFES